MAGSISIAAALFAFWVRCAVNHSIFPSVIQPCTLGENPPLHTTQLRKALQALLFFSPLLTCLCGPIRRAGHAPATPTVVIRCPPPLVPATQDSFSCDRCIFTPLCSLVRFLLPGPINRIQGPVALGQRGRRGKFNPKPQLRIGLLSGSVPPHARRELCSTKCPCVSDAD